MSATPPADADDSQATQASAGVDKDFVPTESSAVHGATASSPAVTPPVRATELLAVIVGVVICDLTIYRGQGYFGLAVALLAVPALLAVGSPVRRWNSALLVMGILLVGTILRLAWCGSAGAVLAGVACLIGFAMALAGLTPYMTRAFAFASQTVAAGHRGLNQYAAHFCQNGRGVPGRGLVFSVGFPLLALFMFGTLFVLANPDLVKSVGVQFEYWADFVFHWTRNFSLMEIPFCVAAAWLLTGLMRPVVREAYEWVVLEDSETDGPAPLYDAFRNTLVMVVALFAVYLVFEFRTLWFREFPEGFHYSGYAHQGAAWLTVALALSTVLLSMIFQGRILHDSRQPRLRLLAWVWSVENLVLSLAVFHRLAIYVDFNGMTRMRTVGWLGIASVVVGFLLVVIKIHRGKDFRWLLRRELWTVSFAAWLYFVMPIDLWITRYNVQRILAGDPAPSVQISEHPLSAEGYLELAPLQNSENEIIRKGILAMLAQKQSRLERKAQRQTGAAAWTRRQLAEEQLLKQLNALPALQTISPGDRAALRAEFKTYAYQWY